MLERKKTRAIKGKKVTRKTKAPTIIAQRKN